MSIVKTISDLNTTLVKQQSKSNKIGLVPTMGSLHEGHLSLIRNASNKCDFVWVTIFINPKQFNNLDDFNAYPKDIDNDIKKIFSISNHIKIFIPSTNEIYPNKKFDGIDGNFYFKNNMIERDLDILKINNGNSYPIN